jgi:hypothetical protein
VCLSVCVCVCVCVCVRACVCVCVCVIYTLPARNTGARTSVVNFQRGFGASFSAVHATNHPQAFLHHGHARAPSFGA